MGALPSCVWSSLPICTFLSLASLHIDISNAAALGNPLSQSIVNEKPSISSTSSYSPLHIPIFGTQSRRLSFTPIETPPRFQTLPTRAVSLSSESASTKAKCECFDMPSCTTYPGCTEGNSFGWTDTVSTIYTTVTPIPFTSFANNSGPEDMYSPANPFHFPSNTITSSSSSSSSSISAPLYEVPGPLPTSTESSTSESTSDEGSSSTESYPGDASSWTTTSVIRDVSTIVTATVTEPPGATTTATDVVVTTAVSTSESWLPLNSSTFPQVSVLVYAMRCRIC